MRQGSNVIESYQHPAKHANAAPYPPQQPPFSPTQPYAPPQRQTPRNPSSEKRGFPLAPAEGWLPLLLLGVAAYCLVYSIIAVNIVEHTNILIWSTAGGLCAGLLIAKIRRFPQLILHLGAVLGGYWLSVWLTSALALHIPWNTLIVGIGAAITDPARGNYSAVVFLFYLTFLSYFLAYFGAWLIYRAHLPWLLALVYGSILLINLNYARQDFSLTIAIFLAALILLIARVQLVNQLAQWKQAGLYTNRSWLHSLTRRFMTIATILTLLMLIGGWLFPVLSQPAQGVVIWNDIDNAWNNITQGRFSWQNIGSVIQSYQTPTNFFSNQMTIAGSVSLPVGEVLYYTSSAGGQYLAGFTYDHFDGHTWTSLAASDSANYDASADLPDDDTGAAATLATVSTSVTLVQPPQSAEHYIFAPFEPGTLSVPTTLYGIPIVAAWGQQSALTPGERYSAMSIVSTASAGDLSQVPLPGVSQDIWNADNNYTTLSTYYLQKPTDLSANVSKTLQAWTAGATSAYAALKSIESHLNNSAEFTYSLTNPPIPANVDVVDWLLRTRQGYCTYYATAMTIMARMLGIPARIVNGFAPGHFDAQRHVWVEDGSDAHSWVQAYLPDYGWINFDPTPGYSFSQNGQSPTPSPTATVHPTRPTPTPIKGQTPRKNHATSPGGSANGDPTPIISTAFLLGGTLFLLICALLTLLFASARYWWHSLYANSPPIPALYWRISYFAGLLGLTPRPSQTPYEFGSRLCRAAPKQAPALWRLTELFVRERWANQRPEQEKRALSELERLRPRLRGTIARLLWWKVAKRGK
jgi:transglutaminase-like putative cysteine protease